MRQARARPRHSARARTPPSSAQTRWATYANARFGTTADYPADLFTRRDPEPENGDGVSLHTADGRAKLIIYGAYNAENDTPASYFQRLVDNDGVTYKQVRTTYYAASGVRGANIFYERCNFRRGDRATVDCFELTYPAREKKRGTRSWRGSAGRCGRARGLMIDVSAAPRRLASLPFVPAQAETQSLPLGAAQLGPGSRGDERRFLLHFASRFSQRFACMRTFFGVVPP